MVDVPSFPGNPNPNTDAPGLFADNILVNATSGTLEITATSGIQFLDNNSLDNALGFGLNVPSATVSLQTTMSNFPTAEGGFAQAGLWFGRGENFGLGTVGDRIQAVGGEAPALAVNEEYDPLTNTWRELTPLSATRHGAAAATIGPRLYIIGGGNTEGTSFTDSVTAFSY